MKFAVLFLGLLSTHLFAGKIHQIELAASKSCVLVEDSGVKTLECVGKKIALPSGFEPNLFSVGKDHVCMADSKKIKCVGNIAIEKDIAGIKILKSGRDTVCYSSGAGLVCQGVGVATLLTPPATKNPQDVIVGKSHACVVDEVAPSRNELLCWGSNKFGKTDVPNTLINPLHVSVGDEFTCVLDKVSKNQNKVICFGKSRGNRTNVPALVHPQTILSGKGFSCSIDLLNYWGETELKCWGQLGDLDGNILITNPLLARSSFFHLCAYSKVDGLMCFGTNISGETNLSYEMQTAEIAKSLLVVSNELKVPSSDALATGYSHACAITFDKKITCWGKDYSSQTVVPKGIVDPVQVVAGAEHTCALHQNKVTCWGDNYFGQRSVPALANPVKLSSTYDSHTCAILKDGSVKCWGKDGDGQVSKIPALKLPVKEVTAGVNYTCALDQEGVKCWGGSGMAKTKVPPMDKVIKIKAGWSHTCALHRKGITCWGDNYYGQSTVPPLTNPISLGVGGTYNCAQTKTETKCWGHKGYNTLSTPKFSDLKYFSLGGNFACAQDGIKVKCWGRNEFKQSEVPVGLKL
ncbi:MAG: hypothetical protein HOE90_21450 [Bacteriovoracaceae bacterium]|nr:hypothetical protein [Bacteriovoracaceae bacterium]